MRGAFCVIFSAKAQFSTSGIFQFDKVLFVLKYSSIQTAEYVLNSLNIILFSLYVLFQNASGGVRFNAILKFIVDLIPDDAARLTEDDRKELRNVAMKILRPPNFNGHGEKTNLYLLVR